MMQFPRPLTTAMMPSASQVSRQRVEACSVVCGDPVLVRGGWAASFFGWTIAYWVAFPSAWAPYFNVSIERLVRTTDVPRMFLYLAFIIVVVVVLAVTGLLVWRSRSCLERTFGLAVAAACSLHNHAGRARSRERYPCRQRLGHEGWHYAVWIPELSASDVHRHGRCRGSALVFGSQSAVINRVGCFDSGHRGRSPRRASASFSQSMATAASRKSSRA